MTAERKQELEAIIEKFDGTNGSLRRAVEAAYALGVRQQRQEDALIIESLTTMLSEESKTER